MFVGSNTVAASFQYVMDGIAPLYEEREASNIARLYFEDKFGLSRAELVLKAEEKFSESELLQIHQDLKRLKTKEPVQYVTGKASFCGLELSVDNHVLIPRPETEELVAWILSLNSRRFPTILDICTGSGCIALALKVNLPEAIVHASDISKEAIEIARKNAVSLSAGIELHVADILEGEPEISGLDILVANPPYIATEESSKLEDNVRKFEPHIALFSNDPLTFYRTIAGYGVSMLKEDGELFLEIHEQYSLEVKEILEIEGYKRIDVKEDLQGRPRMVRAMR